MLGSLAAAWAWLALGLFELLYLIVQIRHRALQRVQLGVGLILLGRGKARRGKDRDSGGNKKKAANGHGSPLLIAAE